MLLRSSLNNLEARELADWLYIATDRDKGYEVELAFFRAYVSALETLPLARGNPKTSGLQTAVSELVKRYRPHWSAEKTGKIAEYSLEKVGLFSRYEPDTHDDIRPAEKGYEVLLAFYRAYFSATSGKQKREGIRLGKRKAA
ncbi:hypothetical protein HY640_03545 [Candidatus Woesearchaeota archaeon]|nr:hypothetical protein [Candidatus Woesearchaeota archaeon]